MKICGKCGGNEFNSWGKCKPCAVVRSAKWRADNPERKKQHSKEWYAKNSDKTKAAAALSQWAKKNPERAKLNQSRWRKENPESNRMAVLKYKARFPEKVKESRANWWAKNPGARRIARQNYHARKIASGGKLSKGLATKLFKLQRGLCACGCGKPLGENYHLDHRMPLALGGTNTDDNMQLLCPTCNLQKSVKHPIEFMQSRGFLI